MEARTEFGKRGLFLQRSEAAKASHDGSAPYTSPIRETLEEVIFTVHLDTS